VCRGGPPSESSNDRSPPQAERREAPGKGDEAQTMCTVSKVTPTELQDQAARLFDDLEVGGCTLDQTRPRSMFK
jgi:hypothetical protein